MNESRAGNAGGFKSMGGALHCWSTRCRRLAWLLVLLATIVGAGIFLAWRWSPPLPRINEAAYEEIRLGMTQPEVEAILRAKPGAYHSAGIEGGFQGSICVKSEEKEAPEGDEVKWESDEAGISVYFGPEGTVTAKYYAIRTGGEIMRLTLLEQIRRMLGL